MTQLEGALDCIRRGWPVFPCRGKVPAIPKEQGGRGFHDATTDEATIRRWVEEHPGCNFGIRAGPKSEGGADIAVVDLDLYHGDCDTTGLDDDTATLITGRGGRQRFYAYPANGNRVSSRNDWRERVDLKAHGGYVMAPGTIHPETGAEYVWDPAHHPDEVDLAPCPRILLDSNRQRVKRGAGKRSRHEALLRQTMRDVSSLGTEKTLVKALGSEPGRELVAEGRAAEIERMVAGASERADLHHTDLGNADRFVHAHGAGLRYVPVWRKWFVWTGRHWTQDETGTVPRLAQDTVRSMYVAAGLLQDEDARKRLVAHALKSERAERIRALLSLAESHPEVAIRHQTLDTNPWLLNVQNGTVDLRNGQLRPHRPEDLVTHVLPVPYDPKAKALKWWNFLARVFGNDQDLIEFAWRACGYSLTGVTREQCLFLLYGTGANGKSTFLEVLRSLLGPLAQSHRFETFLLKRGDAIPNDIARMRGARFITAVEADGERRLSEAAIKHLTGEDTVTARFMRGEYFEFRPEFKLWLAANHKPVIRGTDVAVWRRIKLVPFTVTIPEVERDHELLTKLREELPGILAWAIEGCNQWVKKGLGSCKAVEQQTEAYRSEQDLLGGFLDQECVIDAQCRVSKAHLYQHYTKWCETNGERALAHKQFSQQLRERNLPIEEPRTSAGRFWSGLGLRDPSLDDRDR